MRPLLAFALFWSTFALADSPLKLNDKETKRLDAGELVIREFTPTDNHGIGVESMRVIDAPPNEVIPVLRDCGHFSSFMPRTKDSSVADEAGVPVCHIELRLPFPLPNLWSDTTSVEQDEPGYFHRTWTQVRGSYNHNTGSWTALPWGDEGKKTLVVYLVDSDPKILIPDALLRTAQTGSLPDLFTAIHKRVLTLRVTASRAQ